MDGEEKVLIERPCWPRVVQYFVTGLSSRLQDVLQAQNTS
jgi:hypothetical protein